MAEVIKTIKGRRYRYSQQSKRVNGKVKTTSVYIGPEDERQARALAVAERFAAKVEEYQRAEFGETAAELKEREQREFLADLHSKYGMPSEKSQGVSEKDNTKDGGEKEG